MTLASDSPEETRPTMIVEYASMVIGTKDQLERAHGSFEALAQDFYERCKEIGVQVQGASGTLRPLTHEESLRLIPRKWHLERGGVHACDTPFVSRKFLTQDVGKVTCKLCLKRLREENDRLEATTEAGNS
jgi:predicted oxidoreductase